MVSRLENAALLGIPLVPTAYIVINAVSSIPNLRFALMILIGVSSMALVVSVTRYCIHKRRGRFAANAILLGILVIASVVCRSYPFESVHALAPQTSARERYGQAEWRHMGLEVEVEADQRREG